MTTPVNSRRLALEATSPRVLKVGDNYINLTVTSQQFRIGTNNVSNPTSVTFTASLVGVLSGTVTFNTNVVANQFVAGTTFTGTIAAGTNTLTTVNTPGTPVVGMILNGGNIEPNTYIVSGSGTSWIVSKTQITATSSATLTGTPYTQSGNQLTITPEIMTGDYVVITASLTYQNVTYTSSPISVSKIYSSIGARLSQTFKTYGSYNDGTGYSISSVAAQQVTTDAIYLDLFNGDSAFPRGSAGGITYSPLVGTVVAKDGLKVYLTTDGIVQIVEASSGSWTSDSTNFTLSAIKGGVTYSAIFTVNKQKQGTGGIQYGTISLYRWTVTDPSANSGALLPKGNSTYTWYSQLHVYTPAPVTGNTDSWSLTASTKPTDNNNYLLWKITKAIQQQSARDVTVQTLTGIVWNSDYTLTEVTTTSNEFVKTKTATLYQNGTSSVPNFPVGNAKYTWATETLTLSASGYSTTLNGWTTTLPTPQTGLTLYSFNVDLIESKSATETAIYWDRGYSKIITVYGPQGVIGNSARRAYVVATGTPAGSPATYTATGDALPAVGTWFTGKTWYSTPQAIAEGEVLYQSDGIYVSGGNTTWGSPYISALKVGNLSAITVNTGDLYVSGSIRGGANSSAVAMDINTGSGYYISSTGSFRVGNPGTNYLKWDGTDLIINTKGSVTIGDTAANYLNWNGTNLTIKTSGAVTIGNPTGTRLQWDGSALSIFQGTTAILTAGKLTWNAVSGVPYNVVGNLLDTNVWVTGSTGSQPGFPQNGSTSENSIVVDIGPDGTPKQIWRAYSTEESYQHDPDGGWATDAFTINHLKPYRFSCWIKRVGSLSTGSAWLGLGGNTVTNLAGALNDNPYFAVRNRSDLVQDRWYLFVGYVWPSTYTGNSNLGGIYDGTTGELIQTADSWKWVSGQTWSIHRCYQYYSNVGDVQYFYGPRVDIADGSEPTIDALLAVAKADTAKSSAAASAASAVSSANSATSAANNSSGAASASAASAASAASSLANVNTALQLVGSVTWLGDSTVSIITGTELRKTAGTDEWNASRYSAESFVGGAFVSFQPYNSAYETMIALNSDPTTDSSYTSLDYAWYITQNAAYIWESNAQVDGGWGVNNNSVLSIIYDNQYVRYYIDGILKREIDTGYGSAKRLYLDTSFKYVNYSGAKNIRFGPNASRGSNGSKGDPGNPGGPGAPGARGSSTVYYGGRTSWDSNIATNYFTNTYGSVVLNDTMTQYGTDFSQTRFWDGGSWVQVTVAIDGNLLVSGTISAAKLAANTVIANNIEFTGSLNTKSATSGARMEMTNSTIKVYDANGTIRVKIGNLA